MVYKKLLNGFIFDLTHPSREIFDVYMRYFYNTISARLNETVDYSSEMFWIEQLYYKFKAKKEHPVWWNSNFSRNRCSEEMKLVLESLSKEFGENLRFIDVGSGAVSSFFWIIDINKYNITTIDPLAKFYNELNTKYKINYPLVCTEGVGEKLDELYEPGTFHLTFTFNAIDHCTDPSKFLKNLFYVTKSKGFIYISGLVKVGTAHHWLGLHKHDIEIEGDDLIWTNKSKTVDHVNISQGLNMELFYKDIKGSNQGDRFSLIYQKSI